ncbi:hypothetical protein HZS_2821, partial [Henneguya salminicola]
MAQDIERLGLFLKEFKAIFENEELAIIYLVQNKIVTVPMVYNFCRGTVKQYSKHLKCFTKSCRKRYAFFFWLAGLKNGQIGTIMGISIVTVTYIAQSLRKFVLGALDFNDIIIGGGDIIVEIYNEKLGKFKYHRGHE